MKKILLSLLAMLFSTIAYSQLTEIHLAYPDTFNIRSVSEKDGTLYCIASRYKTYLHNRNFLLKSTDAGDNWTVLKQFTLSKNPMFYAAINDSVHYLVFQNDSNYILKTTNACSSFDTIANLTFGYKESFHAINKDTVVFSGYFNNKGSFLFITRDGFQTIDTVSIDKYIPIKGTKNKYLGYNRRLSIINDSTWVSLTNKINTNKTALIITHDAGVTWDTTTNDIMNIDTRHCRSSHFIDNRGVLLHYTANYSQQHLLLSVDTGHSFSVLDSLKYYQEAQIRNNGYIYMWKRDSFRLTKDYGINWNSYPYYANSYTNLPYFYFHPIYVNDTVIILDNYEMIAHYDPIKGYHKIFRIDINSVGIASNIKKQANFTVYPNPFNSSLKIECNEQFSGKVKLLDIQGRIIIEKEISNIMSLKIDKPDLDAGVYFIKLILESGESSGVVKVIKI